MTEKDAADIIAVLRAHSTELHAAGVRHLSLFGSVARGEAGPESDIDLLAELDPGAHIGLFGLIALENRLTEILGRKADLLTEPIHKDRLRVSVERDCRHIF